MEVSVIELASPEVIAKYEPVIGLEVHVQLATRTKIFCTCPTSFGAPPNTNVCPVCLGLPGALPVLSRDAVELAMKASLALNCQIRPLSRFARKNYFYPDLPKGYQISQYDEPLAEHGYVDIHVDGVHKRIGITRVHMEDDAGKSIHDGFRDSDRYSYVDLNRCGTPLIEIVSEPDMRSSEEAHAYLTELKQVLQFVEVSTCDMEKGHLRCDANVSVRLRGAEEFGTKVEVKNLNSFRFAKMAIDYEISRQVAGLEAGHRIHQETRLYNFETGETAGMRSKEQAHDYRYFPEPDLVPLRVSEAWLSAVKADMPELPAQKRARFVGSYGLREYDAQILTATRAISDYYEEAARVSGDPKASANWVMGDLSGALNAVGKEFVESPVSAAHLGELVALINRGELNGKMAKDIFPEMFETGEAPAVIMDRKGLRQISDAGELVKIVDEVLAANTRQVEQYRSGKTAVIGFLVGQVMKASRGQANPAAVNEQIKKKLGWVFMEPLKEGDKAPAFKLETDTGEVFDLAAHKGERIILYFYPRSDTPGCTVEACEFRDSSKKITRKGALVVGISPDTVKAQARFKTKFDLPFILLADADRKVAETYGVVKEKNMYGKKVMGVARTTFIIGPDGKIEKIFDKVKPEGHAGQILEAL